jgi:hypothetical protein
MSGSDWIAAHWRVHAGGLAAVALVSAMAYGGVIRPRAAAAHEAAILDQEHRQLIERDRAAAEEARQAELKAGELQERLKSLPDVLGPVSALNKRLAELGAAADQFGIRILELKQGAEAPATTHVRVGIRLRGTGTYTGVTHLLSHLHEQFPDLAVSSVALTVQGEDRAQAGVTIEFEWYAERAAPAGATTP